MCLGCLLQLTLGQAQFDETFDDDDLLEGVLWVGDVDHFIVETGRLRLNAPSAGESKLSTLYLWGDSLTMGLDIELAFAPSGSNAFEWYLYARDSNLTSGEALFIRIGESGDQDAFELMYRSADGSTSTWHRFESIPHSTAISTRVSVISKMDGRMEWTFDHDIDGVIDERVELSLTALDAAQVYYGMRFLYTASRVDLYFMDNAFVRKIEPDLIGPQLLAVEVQSLDTWRMTFDEELDPTSIGIQAFDLPDAPDVQIISATRDINSPNQVLLQLNGVKNDQGYTLHYNGILDTFGNSTSGTWLVNVLVAEQPNIGDIIINEIHAAPSMSTPLPNVEFVEIYNTTDRFLNLSEMNYADASASVPLGNEILPPYGYAVVMSANDTAMFDALIHKIGLSSLPTLTNTGERIQLLFDTEVMDEVTYASSWYRDDNKTAGWSLERINPESSCRGAVNWAASIDPTGGTPGEINSVYSPEDVLDQPMITQVQITGENELTIVANITVEDGQNLSELISISPDIDIQSAQLVLSGNRDVMVILFSEALVHGQKYEVLINGIRACNGLEIQRSTFTVGLPEEISPGDLIISEILYDPYTGESEFIELFNASNKILNLEDMWLSLTTSSSSSRAPLSDQSILIPGAYYVLTSNIASVVNRYSVPYPSRIMMKSFPNLTNGGGVLNLYTFDSNGDSNSIDVAGYGPSYHDPLATNTKGYSLEKLHLNGDGISEHNWSTAAQTVGGATPTGMNSQSLGTVDPGEDYFHLESKTFSPDGDGYEDAAILRYNLDEAGYIAQIKVHAFDGQPIKQLANNSSLGTTGQILWYGDTDSGDTARMGIYYILIEAFTPTGDRIVEKHKIVLAKPL